MEPLLHLLLLQQMWALVKNKLNLKKNKKPTRTKKLKMMKLMLKNTVRTLEHHLHDFEQIKEGCEKIRDQETEESS